MRSRRSMCRKEIFFEVKFEDFEADAFGTTKLAYEKLGIREFDCAEAAIRQYTDRKKGYKKNKYEYKPRTIQLVNENWDMPLRIGIMRYIRKMGIRIPL